MKTDLELLKLAAKAAGYEINFEEPCNVWYPHGFDKDGDVDEWWNPLFDDGQALRLAVKLDMLIDFSADEGWIDIMGPLGTERIKEAYGSDPMAATRRAITMAAAARGEHMP